MLCAVGQAAVYLIMAKNADGTILVMLASGSAPTRLRWDALTERYVEDPEDGAAASSTPRPPQPQPDAASLAQ